jgi:hypothetical protein
MSATTVAPIWLFGIRSGKFAVTAADDADGADANAAFLVAKARRQFALDRFQGGNVRIQLSDREGHRPQLPTTVAIQT